MDKKAQDARNGIFDEMGRIERMRMGTRGEQCYGTGVSRRAPCDVLQGYAVGTHGSRRVPREHVVQVWTDNSA